MESYPKANTVTFMESILILNKKLRRVSVNVFREAGPPQGRSARLKWRRMFNFVSLPLKNIKIITSCNVHEIKFESDLNKYENPLELVKTNIYDGIEITGLLDNDLMLDSIYFAVMQNVEDSTFAIERVAGQQKVTLSAGNPTEESESIPVGLYYGGAFRMKHEPGEDDLCFDLCIPKDQMQSLIAAIRADENANVEVEVYLLSFTLEADDLRREFYNPRDIIVDGSTPCFVLKAEVTSKIGNQSV
jgi:hypothetical protein